MASRTTSVLVRSVEVAKKRASSACAASAALVEAEIVVVDLLVEEGRLLARRA
jgi:hypothetical protein